VKAKVSVCALMCFLFISFQNAVADRPDFLISLRQDNLIYLGLGGHGYKFQVCILPTATSFHGLFTDDYSIWTWNEGRDYLTSFSKSFSKEDYQTGIEWLFGLNWFDSWEYHNAVGYFVAKDFDRINVQMGAYLRTAYRGEYFEHVQDSTSEYWILHRSELEFRPMLSWGIQYRI